MDDQATSRAAYLNTDGSISMYLNPVKLGNVDSSCIDVKTMCSEAKRFHWRGDDEPVDESQVNDPNPNRIVCGNRGGNFQRFKVLQLSSIMPLTP